MGLFDFFKKGFTKKRSVNSKRKSKKRSTLVFKNIRTDKHLRVPNKTFTLEEFNEKYNSRTSKIPFFKKGTAPKTHLQIMFDPDVPKGEKKSGNKVFVHYLKLGKKTFFEYYPPSPPEGTHNYHCLSVYIDSRKKREALYKILKDADERKHPIFQSLKKKPMKLGNIEITAENILLENHFKVKN